MSDPPTDAELPLLNQFRDKLKNELSRKQLRKDHYLLRWLRARDLDVEKATTMLKASLAWRKEREVDFVLDKPIPTRWSDVIDGLCGPVDNAGRAVICLPAGEWDVRSYLDEGFKDELIEFLILSLEVLEATMEEMWQHGYPQPTQYPHTKFTVIIDLKGFTYAKFAHKKSVEALIDLVKIYEANYPESLGRCVIFNSPRIFSILFAMIKPFLHQNTVSKIAIFDSNEKSWKKEILEFIDASQLPPKYGGSKVDHTQFA